MRTAERQLLEHETLLLIYIILILLILSVFAVVFVIAFQKRKNKMLRQRFEAEKRFERELADTRVEIQEQTFKNIAWELHDNVGQLLSVAKIQLNMLSSTIPENFKDDVAETGNIVSSTLEEIRTLSRSLNNDVVLKNGLVKSLENDLERIERLRFCKTSMTVEGTIRAIEKSSEIIIFRILQEFLNNVLKHSEADTLKISLTYFDDRLEVVAADDGKGFDTEKKSFSSGLETMNGRAKLIDATYNLESKIGEGTQIKLVYPYKK